MAIVNKVNLNHGTNVFTLLSDLPINHLSTLQTFKHLLETGELNCPGHLSTYTEMRLLLFSVFSSVTGPEVM